MDRVLHKIKNMFANVDLISPGCRQENYDFCIEIAFFHYNECGNKSGDWDGKCKTQQTEEQAECAQKYPHKRSLDAAPETPSQSGKGWFGKTDNQPTCGDSGAQDVFHHADADQDGLLDLEEYIAFMKGQRGNGLNHTVYADYFHSYVLHPSPGPQDSLQMLIGV